jgi:hypothetical protein
VQVPDALEAYGLYFVQHVQDQVGQAAAGAAQGVDGGFTAAAAVAAATTEQWWCGLCARPNCPATQ